LEVKVKRVILQIPWRHSDVHCLLWVLLCCYRWSESRMLEISAQIAHRLGKYVTDFQSYEKEKA